MRDLIFRREWTTEHGVQFRFDVMLPHTDALSATPTVVEIPDECIVKFGKLTIGYDKLPVGQPEFKSMTMAFNLGSLSGNADLELLRDCLLTPSYSGCTIGPVGSGNVAIDTYTWCRLYYHEGIEYRKIFEGAMRRTSSAKFKVTDATTSEAYTTVEVQWSHMVQVVLETLRMETLCTRMLENITPGGGNHKTLYDGIYKHSSSSFVWAFGQGLYGDNVPQALLYELDSLFEELSQLAQQIYRKMVRNATATFVCANEISGPVGTPLAHLTFYRQIYDGSMAKGGSVSGSVRFIGRVWPANKTMSMSNDVAGLLVGNPTGGSEQNSLHRFANVWDWLKMLTDGLLCKTEFRYASTGIVVLWLRVYDTQPHAVTTIAASATLGNDIEIERGTRSITSVNVAVPGMEGDDVADYSSVKVGVENEEDRPMRLPFHTLPKLGSVNDRISRGSPWAMSVIQAATWGQELPGVTTPSVGIFCRTFSMWQLWYFHRPQTPGGTYLTDADVYIRCHNDVAIDVGTPTGGAKVLSHTSAGTWNFHTPPYWPDPFRGTLLTSQRNDGMPQHIADSALSIFGNPDITLYKIRVLVGTLYPEQVGDIFKLGSGGTANDFIAPDTYLADFSTTGHFVHCEMALDTGIITAEILHIPELS